MVRTRISSVALYGNETSSLILRKESELDVNYVSEIVVPPITEVARSKA
jgi:hypothetical protein